MSRKLYSVNSLALELRRDRGTVTRALQGVPPDGTLYGRPAWHLQTVLAAIDAARPAASGEAGGRDQIGEELERLAGEIDAGFKLLAAEKSIERRRELARGIGPAIGALEKALSRSTAGMSAEAILVSQPFRDRLVGGSIGELLRLCQWTIAPAA